MSTDFSREQLIRELGDEVRAGQRATDKVDELVSELLGINRTDARCLDILDQHGRVTAGQIATMSGLSTGAVTNVIDRLERAGYAQRVADPADRRRVLVELTERARALSWELMGRPMMEASLPLIARYGDGELRLLLEFARASRELQERHAQWLRARLEQGDYRAGAGSEASNSPASSR